MCAEKYLQPLVYSCSGCSNVAQLANDLAVVLDREGHAQMSCIAGVGANVKPLVAVAQSGRPILAIDGCKIACVKKTLAMRHITPQWHLELTGLGFQKVEKESCSFSEMNKALHTAYDLLHTYDLTNNDDLTNDIDALSNDEPVNIKGLVSSDNLLHTRKLRATHPRLAARDD